jgi:hypothetical protein
MGAVVDRLRNMLGPLLEAPVPLASAWVAWLAFGLVLAFWFYQARKSALAAEAPVHAFSKPRPIAKSSVRPPAKPAPRPDAFEELQTLLDGPQPSESRRPGD